MAQADINSAQAREIFFFCCDSCEGHGLGLLVREKMAFVRLLSRRVSSTALGAALGGASLSGVALCNEDHIPPILVGFDHEGPLQAFDAKAVRRGFQVYKEVCSTCHSMERMAFRNMVEYGAWTESEAKEIAEAYEIVDGPNDEGEMFERPGKLSDNLPSPYANEEACLLYTSPSPRD